MKDIKSISKELWRIIVRLFFLLWQLGRQIVLPNRRRKGNLLNTLFLFYIGVIESIQHFEHRQFKLSDFFQHKLVRRGLMLAGFLLFLLTSFEQPVAIHSPVKELSEVQCSLKEVSGKSTYDFAIERVSIRDQYLPAASIENVHSSYSAPSPDSQKLYLDNRSLLI